MRAAVKAVARTGVAILRQSDISEAGPRLRPLTPEDIGALADLWVAAWQHAWAGQPAAIDFAARREWLVTFLRAPQHRTIVADAAGRVLGFATLEGDYLHQLAVDPRAQGKGLGTVLLGAAERAASGPLELDVNAENGPARAFYARQGYAVIGSGRNPASGLDTLRLRKASSRP